MTHDTSAQKAEINSTIQTMMVGAYITGALIVAGYLMLVQDNPQEILRTLFLVIISLTGVIAQGDHKIFRLGHWVRLVENSDHDALAWEEHKFRLRSRKVVMPIVDSLMAAAPLYVLFKLCAIGYELDPVYTFWAGLAAIGGVAMIFIGQRLARW